MGNELIEVFAEYAEEVSNDPPRKEIVEQLRNKLIAKITPENINDAIDVRQNTLLHSAVFYEDTVFLRWLLDHNAKLDVKNKSKDTPMRDATTYFFTECITILHAAGGNIDDIDGTGCTSLCDAIRSGAKEKVKFFLDLNANVHAIDNAGQTILDSALLLIQNHFKWVSDDNKFAILRLLFENYIGIGTDLTGIELPPGVVDGLPVIWATKDGEPITNKTPGFENAICSVENLLQSRSLNFKKLQYVLEKVFRPYFPESENLPYEYVTNIYSQLGMIRKNNFEKAGPELEKLYKTLRIRTAGVSSLRDLASTALMIKHGLKAEKAPQLTADAKSTPLTETQKLTENENNNKPVQSSDAALLIKQGLHAEKIPVDNIKSTSPAETQNLTDNQTVQPTEKMKLVADAILDPQKLALMPPDLVEYIEKLGNEIQEKLGHNDLAKKIETK